MRPAFLLLAFASGVFVASGFLAGGGMALLLAALPAALGRRHGSEYDAFVVAALDRLAAAAVLLGCVVGLRAISYGSLIAAATLGGYLLAGIVPAPGGGDAAPVWIGTPFLLLGVSCLADPWLSVRDGVAPGRLVEATLGLLGAAALATAVRDAITTAKHLRPGPAPRALWAPAPSRSPLP